MEFQPSIRNHGGGSTSGRSFDMTSPTAQGSTNLIAISVIYFDHGLVSGCHKKWWHVVSSYLFFGRVSRTSEKSIKRSGSWYSESWFKRKSTGKPYTCMCVYIYIFIYRMMWTMKDASCKSRNLSRFFDIAQVRWWNLACPVWPSKWCCPDQFLERAEHQQTYYLCCFDLVRLNGYLMI